MPMNEVEARFKQWLDQKGYAYLFIEQSVSSFPSLFRGIAKRPDFLVMVRHFGMIAVDVKAGEINPRDGYKDFILDEEKEVRKYLELERIFRLPVWFVFAKKDEDFKNWYWIPLSRVLECPLKKSGGTAEPFRAVNPSDCIVIQSNRNDGLSRLIE